MNIKLKNADSRWMVIGDAEFLIDYPNLEQQDEINELQTQLFLYRDVNVKPIEGETNEDFNKRFFDEINKLEPEIKSKISSLTTKVCRLYMKYSIKNWKNINDENGQAVKCKIVNDAIEDELFKGFIRNFDYLELLTFFNEIKPKVEFTDTDKKKL